MLGFICAWLAALLAPVLAVLTPVAPSTDLIGLVIAATAVLVAVEVYRAVPLPLQRNEFGTFRAFVIGRPTSRQSRPDCAGRPRPRAPGLLG